MRLLRRLHLTGHLITVLPCRQRREPNGRAGHSAVMVTLVIPVTNWRETP